MATTMVWLMIFVSLVTLGHGDRTIKQEYYPACPVNYSPTYYCCDFLNGKRFVFTKFTQPTGFQEYKDGWKLQRQVNFPYTKYQPSTPEFQYHIASSICRVQSRLVQGVLQQDLQCGTQNASLVADSQLAAFFWTYNENPRNNNATCPDGATWTSLMKPNHQVDLIAKSKCVPDAVKVNALTSSMLDWHFFMGYLSYAAGFFFVLSWFVFKYFYSKTNAWQNDKAEPILSVHEPDHISQTGYSNHGYGTAAYRLLILLTLIQYVVLTMIICDNYAVLGISVIAPGETILGSFIAIWSISVVWHIVLIAKSSKLRNYFRLKVPLESSMFVHIRKEKQCQVFLHDRSGVADIVRKIEEKIFGKQDYAQEITTCVFKTQHYMRAITFQHLQYIYSESSQRFVPGVIACPDTYDQVQVMGINRAEHARRFSIVGPNAIDVAMPTILDSIIEECASFFYLYQLFGFFIWFYYSYWNLGLIMVVVVVFSAIINITNQRKMQWSIVTMTRYEDDIRVFRSNEWSTVSSCDIVPGDVICLKRDWILPCDIILIQGAPTCDESMLTGEAMPVQKFPIPDSLERYDPEGSGMKHTLFSGTQVLASSNSQDIVGAVKATGIQTVRGKLVQNILFPIRLKFKYDEHLKALVVILILYSLVVGYFIIEFLMANGNLTNKLNIFGYVMFVLMGCVNPLLPVVITVGQVNAAKRLEKLGIYTLNKNRIVLSGKVRVFCFDKTGTLTMQGLDFIGCYTLVGETIQPVADCSAIWQMGLATCHSVSINRAELIGNAVEVTMFRATGAEIITPHRIRLHEREFEVIRCFEFNHEQMTMSVVVRDIRTKSVFIFCKGSYEKLQKLCTSVPTSYSVKADIMAQEGYYTLAMGYRELGPVLDVDIPHLRGNIEANLSLLGLLLFRNELKPDSKAAIVQLKAGQIRPVMITGDSALCGIHIAYSCGMISQNAIVLLGQTEGTIIQWTKLSTKETYSTHDVLDMLSDNPGNLELAVTGPAFDLLQKYDDLLIQIRIFGRMTPAGKASCVKKFMDHGIVTGMAGDGGNDCGALRVSHVGIALSDTDASIVSPFTSNTKSIHSVVDLCREGRCSLATSFASVKFQIMVGLISSILRLIQSYHGVILSEWGFIMMDGVIQVGFSYALTLSRPLPTLGSQRPTSSFIGVTTLVSLFGQLCINVFFLYIGINRLVGKSWYCPFAPENIDLAKWWLLSDNSMATCLLLSGLFQRQVAALVFSFGSRFRLPVWQNAVLMTLFLVMTSLDSYLVLGSPGFLTDLFRVASGPNVIGLPDIPLPFSFRLEYFLIVLANSITVIIFESLVLSGPIRKSCRKFLHDPLGHLTS